MSWAFFDREPFLALPDFGTEALAATPDDDARAAPGAGAEGTDVLV